jgi:outer membrane protein TolC
VEIALAPEGAARVRLAAEGVRLADARRREAQAALLPYLDGTVEYRDQTVNLQAFGINFGNFFTGLPIPAPRIKPVSGPFQVFDARFNARQSLFDFSSIERYRAAKRAKTAAEFDLETARNQTAEAVARAYLAAVRADAAVETAKANQALAEAILRQTRNVKEAGTGTGIEVTRAQVQLADARQRLVAAENERRRARLQLLKVVGLAPNYEPVLSDPLAYRAVAAQTVEAALAAAKAERAEIRAQQAREEAARLGYGAAKAERYPTAGAFANYGSIGGGINNALPTYTAGIRVTVPLFNGGLAETHRAQAAAAQRQEAIRTRDLLEQVELEVRLALDALQSAEEQVRVAREGLTQSENELAQARRRYEAGVANSLELTDAQTRLERARENSIAAVYQHNLARVSLAAATGAIRQFAQ